MLCARAIFRLAEEEETRDLVRFNGGLDPLVEMLSDNTNQDDMVTIYFKCRFIQSILNSKLSISSSYWNIKKFFLFYDFQELMAAVTGAIWKCATDSYENVERFEELDLVKILVNILKVSETIMQLII